MTDNTTVVSVEENSIVVSTELETQIVTLGTQGPPGPQGIQGPQGVPGSGINVDVSLPTNSPISGQRVVRVDSSGFVQHANSDQPNFTSIIGVTTHAVTDNTPVNVRIEGEIVDSAFAFIPGGTLFLGSNGNLTQIAPTSGLLVQIGHAISATKIIINIKAPIILS